MRPPLGYGVFGCSLRYAPWRTQRYAVCPIWPSCAIMREDPRIFFAHTLRHLLVEDVDFLFLGPAGVNIFSRVRESGLRDEHAAITTRTPRVAHGDAMVARETRSE
jgi:hypothetical protein